MTQSGQAPASSSPTTRTESARWPEWTGLTVVCIATGPSLTAQQLLHVRSARDAGRVRALAVCDAGLPSRAARNQPAAPWADLWYAADEAFWKKYAEDAAASTALRVSADQAPVKAGITQLRVDTMCDDRAERYEPGYAISGGHSGYQALQIAAFCGAVKIILLGYDCRMVDGQRNYYGAKPAGLVVTNSQSYPRWAAAYSRLRLPPGVTVLNATPGSAITCYESVQSSQI